MDFPPVMGFLHILPIVFSCLNTQTPVHYNHYVIKRSAGERYADSIDKKYESFHCKVHSYVKITPKTPTTTEPNPKKAYLPDISYILYLTHPLAFPHLLSYHLNDKLFCS
jgi:hypothetical protein